MNVIVSNKYRDLLNSLDFDISKNLNGEFTVDEIIQQFANFFFNKMFLDITAIKDYKNLSNIQKLSINLDMSKIILFLDDNLECSSPQFLSELVGMGIYNFTRNKEGLIYLYDHPNVYRDVAHLHNIGSVSQVNNVQLNVAQGGQNSNNINNNVIPRQIIGVKNLTSHAGATSLIYMMKKILEEYYNVIAVEINKRDFIFLRDKDMYSINSSDVFKFLSENASKLILVDLNDTDGGFCTDVLYLIEPSTIKLNKMVMIDRNVFNKYSDKKIVLNKCLLDNSEVGIFQREASVNIYHVLPPINDKGEYSNLILPLLDKLGFVKQI